MWGRHMRRRLAAQLGFAFLGLLFGTGVALADSSPSSGDQTDPGQTSQVSEQSSTTTSNSDQVIIQTSSTSSQTVGDSGTGSSDGTTLPPSPIVTDSSGQPTSIAAPADSQPAAAPSVGPVATVAPPANQANQP